MPKEFTEDLQKLFLSFLISDKELFLRVQSLVVPEYFNNKLRPAVKLIREHADQYNSVPTIEQVKGKANVQLELDKDITARHKEWFVDEFQDFAKFKALEKAILASADDIEKGEYYSVEKRIKEASDVGLATNLGTNYFHDPLARLKSLRENNGQVSTGWTAVDKRLFGGFNKGELNIFAGGSGAGKSLFLQNLALNWALEKLNVVYVTLELSEELVAMRLDSMNTGMNSKTLFKNMEDVDLKVRMLNKTSGALQIVYLPSGVNVSQLKSYVKEYEIQSGLQPQAIVIDYLDLMMPNDKRVSPSDLFVKDKYVAEELRNLAVELDMLLVTASQLNRTAVEEIEFDHSHIAGGLSKVQTADNVMGIFTSAPMRERGRYQLQFMKTRSSSGVGQRVDLQFNIESLRISDLPEGEEEQPSEILYSNIVRKSSVTDDKESDTGRTTEVKASNLRKMIQNMNKLDR
jgi:KaiC/GvpD/RAD55 family RecA-like ATPase|tara:strand:+ start:17499 stop:18881 length:1383 start_codon:yes stop_codon:yes gene_type:complete